MKTILRLTIKRKHILERAQANELSSDIPAPEDDPVWQNYRDLLNLALMDGLPVLDAVERDLIINHYGLAGYEPESLQDIGKRLDNITWQAVSTREQNILAKLRRFFARETRINPLPTATANGQRPSASQLLRPGAR